MSSLLAAVVISLGIPASAGQLPTADKAKLKDRIDALESDLLRITRELEELRGQLADKKPLPKQQKLLRALDESYQKLLAQALDQELLVAAGKAFDRGDAEAALRMLRTGRHLAAVPLILKDMLRRQSQAKLEKDELKGHLLALALLTGEEVEERFAKIRFVGLFVEDWWLPKHDRFNTDIGKMSPAQVAHLARRLRDVVEKVDAYTSNGPSYFANALLYRLVYYREDSPDRRGPPSWFAEELHPALGPAFLAGMGYRPDGAGGQDVLDVPYQLVHLLAAMRKNSALPQLDKVAEDSTQNSGLRLVCLIALNSAGERVRVPAILSILAREKKLDRKLAALEFLYFADDLEPAADYLLEVLDDANAEVRQSALNAIRKSPPPRLFKRLRQMAEAKHQERVLETIAAVKTIEAQQYLADYLAKTMNDRPKTERIYDALWAFQHSVNQSWVSAGRYEFAYYHKLATTALAWWKENKGK